jgi:hypothetical protein
LFSAGLWMKGFACQCGRHARYDCVTTRSMPVMLTALFLSLSHALAYCRKGNKGTCIVV